MPLSPLWMFCFGVFCLLGLEACAGHKKPEPESHGTLSTIGSTTQKEWEKGKMSPLNEKLFSATKAYPGSKETFKTATLPTDKVFHSGHDTFQTKEFAGAKKEVWDAKNEFHGADRKNTMTDKTFATKDNSMGGKMSPDAKTMFHGGDTMFHAKNDVVGNKAVEKSKKPENMGMALTETELQKLLNKN